MYIEFLRKTRIAENKCCYQLNLFTNGHSVEEIRRLKADGRKIVCFGADKYSYFYIIALKEAGIGPDIVTDNGFKTIDLYLDDIPVSQPTVLLKEKEKYYFIVTLTNTKFVDQVRKQLLLWGVEDFAILTHDIMFDFDRAGHKGLKDAFLKSFNKIYKDIDCTEDNFNTARYNFSHLMIRWYDAVEWVLAHYTGRENLSLLDVGPGIGLASLIYKELLGVSLNWINLKYFDCCHRTSAESKLIESEKIKNQYGYIEVEKIEGFHDIIILTDVIEHFAYNPVNTLKKLNGMLKPQGHLVVDMPVNRKKLPYYCSWRDLPVPNEVIGKNYGVLKITGAGHVYEYTSEELNEIFIESGYKIIHKKIKLYSSIARILCICAKQ